MWTCKKCYEEIEDTFDACWKCSSNELTSEKKTNWSVNGKYYIATVVWVSSLCYVILFCYLNRHFVFLRYIDELRGGYRTSFGILKEAPIYSVPISIFLLYISENQSTKLKTEKTKTIIITLIITILVYMFIKGF